MKKFTAFVLVLAACLTVSFAKEKEPSLPDVDESEVIIITKVNTGDLNLAKRIYTEDTKYIDGTKIILINYNLDSNNKLYKKYEKKLTSDAKKGIENESTPGEYLVCRCLLNSKTRELYIPNFKGFIFGNRKHSFFLPTALVVTVPENTKYVYLGDFNYKLDNALRINSAERKDNFKAACKAFEEKFGSSDVLERAAVRAMTDEEIKKYTEN